MSASTTTCRAAHTSSHDRVQRMVSRALRAKTRSCTARSPPTASSPRRQWPSHRNSAVPDAACCPCSEFDYLGVDALVGQRRHRVAHGPLDVPRRQAILEAEQMEPGRISPATSA